jgi:glycosyltransferase involved in cell wall biosynthesis/SAM-dependent methyltransferase
VTLDFTGERLVPGAAGCEPTFGAKMYHEHAARYLFAAQAVEGKRVLDVGCGVGYGTALLADAGAREVVAFDLSEEAIGHARAHFARPVITYAVGSAESFDFGQFDVVTCFELIEHVAAQDAVLSGIAAALPAGGIAFASTPRPQGDAPRSAFHVKELEFDEFRALVERHFAEVCFWFEANQYGSRIDRRLGSGDAEVTLLEPGQFDSRAADYFIAAVGGADADALRPVHVVGDDAYVLNLEHDVAILQESQEQLKGDVAAILQESERLKEDVAALREANHEYEERVRRAEARLARAEQRRHQAEQRLAALAATVSWRVTRPLRSVRAVPRRARRFERRVQDAHRRRGTLGLLAVAPARLASATRWRRAGTTDLPKAVSMTDSRTLGRLASSFVDVVFLIGMWEGESKRYRVANLADGLRELDLRVLVLDEAESHVLVEHDISPRCLVVFRAALDAQADAQRTVFAHVRAGGGVVITDFDDLVFEPAIIESIDGFKALPEMDRSEYVRGVFGYRRMLEEADVVTCPTAFLADYVRGLGRPAAVVRNSLDAAQLELAADVATRERAADGGRVEIAYLSGTPTHQADFAEAVGAIERILDDRPNTIFTVVGYLDLPDSWTRFGLRVRQLPFMPYLDLLRTLANVDINIAPLVVGNDFCEAKSELKIFEAGAVGVPTIASATRSYSGAIEDGVDGFLVRTRDEWYTKLTSLVDSAELRRIMGDAARARSLEHYSYRAAAAEFAAELGLKLPTQPTPEHASTTRRISWIIPGLIVGGGGHRNTLRAAYQLEQLGAEIELYFTEWDADEQELHRLIHTHFYPLRARVSCYAGSIPPCDVLFATHWSTVKPALDNRASAGEVMYFVQDFEPLFYPMGSEYLLAESTYRKGLYHITTGAWCEGILRTRFGAEADHFQFPIDTSIYFPRARSDVRRRILFFAKPEMPRRCYTLGAEALAELYRLRPDLEIVFFGSTSVDTSALDFPVTVAGILDLDQLAELYSNADLGLVFSPTNPSLVPYEMMACGLPVVDLDSEFAALNYGGDGDVALLADADPRTMAVQIADLLADTQELRARSLRGNELVSSFPTEEEMGVILNDLIERRLAKVETAK